MDWKSTKDGLAVKFTKDNLTVMWDLGERRYEVRRKDGDTETVVEKGSSRHMDIETFLHYVDMTWGDDNSKNEDSNE